MTIEKINDDEFVYIGMGRTNVRWSKLVESEPRLEEIRLGSRPREELLSLVGGGRERRDFDAASNGKTGWESVLCFESWLKKNPLVMRLYATGLPEAIPLWLDSK